VELFHAEGRRDGQIDMTKLRVAFRNSAYAHKKADCICKRKRRGKWAVTEVKEECSSGCFRSPKNKKDKLPDIWTCHNRQCTQFYRLEIEIYINGNSATRNSPRQRNSVPIFLWLYFEASKTRNFYSENCLSCHIPSLRFGNTNRHNLREAPRILNCKTELPSPATYTTDNLDTDPQLYRVFFFSCLKDKRRPKAPPDVLPALRRTPLLREV
jgi:hypothetical protein